MARIIAMVNSKGGVGKSTTTSNLGSALSNCGKRVLVVDLDEQQTITNLFKIDMSADDSINMMDCLLTPQHISPEDVIIPINEHLHVLPVNGEELRNSKSSFTKNLRGVSLIKEFMAKVSEQYDYIILDTPGSKEIYTLMGLSVANDLIIPLRPNDVDWDVTNQFLNFIEDSVEINPNMKISGILFTQVDMRDQVSKNFMKELFVDSPLQSLVFKTVIRNTSSVHKATRLGNTAVNLSKSSNAAKDHKSLAQEVLQWA